MGIYMYVGCVMYTIGTAKPSARVGNALVWTGFPAFMAAVKLAHCSLSTPCKKTHNCNNHTLHGFSYDIHEHSFPSCNA